MMKGFGRVFRQGPLNLRRKILEAAAGFAPEDPPGTAGAPGSMMIPAAGGKRNDFSYTGIDEDLADLADVMVEQAVGYMGIPLGVAGPLLIDGREYMIPMATEEPSVVAAVTFAGSLTGRHGGFITTSAEPVMTAQIFLEDLGQMGSAGVEKIMSSADQIQEHLKPVLFSMEERGGGWRGIDARWIAPSRTLAVNLRIDVRDAMGANLLNSAAEKLGPLLQEITGGSVLMGILSNRSWDRTGSARFSIPVGNLGKGSFTGEETARRIVRAARVAREDPDRAVTHNKGIMNGISALALATGNDTRAVEAAAHAYAGRYGPYHGLSEYWLENGLLHGSLEMPLPFAVTGGAVGFHPVSRWSLEILGRPDAPGLGRIAAALGLAQNLAALRALVSEGIQKGHMTLHARRLAFDAGARGENMDLFAEVIRSEGLRSREMASRRFNEWIQNREKGTD